MEGKKILIIDDDRDIREALSEYLTDHGFELTGAVDGVSGFLKAEKDPPNLILLDVELPDLSGYEVCKKIRATPALQHTPVIMLTGHSMEKEELHGFRSGADDYIAKPFKLAKVLARIQTAIGRNRRELDANALTHLPGNQSILDEIKKRIQFNNPFSVLYFDLNNFKAFNDFYGFIRGDEAIRLTSKILTEEFSASPLPEKFIGHIGGDDFVGVIASYEAEKLCEDIIRRFNEVIPTLYDANDRENGYIASIDRKGAKINVPIMGLAVAVVTNRHKVFEHPGEIALIAGDLKHWVKSANSSAYVIDRRS
jgi:diguanylate cyclase (GGDEF)-like protein